MYDDQDLNFLCIYIPHFSLIGKERIRDQQVEGKDYVGDNGQTPRTVYAMSISVHTYTHKHKECMYVSVYSHIPLSSFIGICMQKCVTQTSYVKMFNLTTQFPIYATIKNRNHSLMGVNADLSKYEGSRSLHVIRTKVLWE